MASARVAPGSRLAYLGVAVMVRLAAAATAWFDDIA
jgi:hypothetical protein